MIPIKSATSLFRELASGLLHLTYPDLCVACRRELPAHHGCFCLKCRLKLHPSDMHSLPDNEFTRRFWGRLPLTAGGAMYYFNRHSPIQKALHRLKYRNQPDIGLQIGRAYGRLLAPAPGFDSVDFIVPVPLHPKKEKLRGYNQSAVFGRGLSETLGVPLLENALVRSRFANSQTHKKRLERFQYLQNTFVLPKPQALAGKHILLVDDILTTGATLELCGAALFEAPGLRLSMATIAIAML